MAVNDIERWAWLVRGAGLSAAVSRQTSDPMRVQIFISDFGPEAVRKSGHTP
jgi:hypothetical protein